jgi:hypothetical protein
VPVQAIAVMLSWCCTHEGPRDTQTMPRASYGDSTRKGRGPVPLGRAFIPTAPMSMKDPVERGPLRAFVENTAPHHDPVAEERSRTS